MMAHSHGMQQHLCFLAKERVWWKDSGIPGWVWFGGAQHMPGVLCLQSMNLALAHEASWRWLPCQNTITSSALSGMDVTWFLRYCWGQAADCHFASLPPVPQFNTFVFANIRRAAFVFFFVRFCGCVLNSPCLTLNSPCLHKASLPKNAQLFWTVSAFGGADENSHLSWENSGHVGHTIFRYNRSLPPCDYIDP